MLYQKQFIISLIESVYILYMFILFRTTLSIHHPLESLFTSRVSWLQHPILYGEKSNKICLFGKWIAVLLSIWFMIRFHYSIQYNQIVIWSIFIGSLILNLNAFLYFLPIILIEFYFGFI